MATRKTARERKDSKQKHDYESAPRPSKADLEKRYNALVAQLLSGARRAEILQYAAETWLLSERQTDEYIARATELIKTEASKERAELLVEQIAVRRMLRKQAIAGKDYRLALEVVKDETKLFDLYPSTKVRVRTWHDDVIDLLRSGKITPEQVIAELGAELATELIVAAGVRRNEGGETQAADRDSGEPARPGAGR